MFLLLTSSCECAPHHPLIFYFSISFFHETFVVLASAPPERYRAEVAEGGEDCDQGAVEGRVREHPEFVGEVAEDGWGDGLR